MTKADLLTKYHAAGHALIPLRGKAPTRNDWQHRTAENNDLPALTDANYGVVLRDTDIIIDVDPRNFPKGDKPLARLVAALPPGSLAGAYTVRTPSGGIHVYLSKPAGVRVRQKHHDYPGIDFLSAGKQVVGPGSVNAETGKAYEVIAGSPDAPRVAAPQALLDLLAYTVETGTADPVKDYDTSPATLARYLDYLDRVAPLAVQGKGGDATTFKVAAFGRDLALSPTTVLEAMTDPGGWNDRCSPPWSIEDLQSKIRNAYKYGKNALGASAPPFDKLPEPPAKPPKLSWNLSKGGAVVIKCFNNLLNYLRLPDNGLYRIFGYNEFTGQVEFVNPAPWHKNAAARRVNPGVNDNDLKMLKAFLVAKHDYEASIQHLEEAVTVAAHDQAFHPVREYLKGLKWDGVPRLSHWLRDYLGVEDTPYTQAVARKTLCAAVMRVMKPGCKFDHVLVLEGPQDIGKSTVCRILGGEWAGDFPVDPTNRDTVQLLQGKWIVELSELEFADRFETDAVKAFLTRTTDRARLAYGRLSMDFPRQSIFIASKNPGADGAYLRDETGNRRWWPVECKPQTPTGKVDFKAFQAVRNQLWAEAVHLVSSTGENLYMDTEALKTEAAGVAADRQVAHPWAERIGQFLAGLPSSTKFLTGADVFVQALGGIDKQFDRRAALGVASCMRVNGWHPSVRHDGRRSVRGYLRNSDKSATEAADDILKGLW